MQISFHGAARNVTGSKHLITTQNGISILLDCGMYQGMGDQTENLNEHFGFNPAKLDYLILSHAHIDHIGLTPRLTAQGFKGTIYCTAATMDLARILLMDSAKIQEQDAEYASKHRREGEEAEKPLYTEQDVIRCMKQFKIIAYHEEHQIAEGIRLTFTDAGHIIGSSAVHLEIRENGKSHRISFSGDVGRYDDLILKAPQKFPQADYLILESTYGDTLHRESEDAGETFREIIYDTCIRRKGKVIIPAFSVGRTQELLYLLNGLAETNKLPDVRYYVDSPLSGKATEVVKRHTGELNHDVHQLMKTDADPFSFAGLNMIDDVAQSKALNASNEPAVIISASGMAEAGRVRHHIRNAVSDDRNTILMVGYCEPDSLAGKLVGGARHIWLFGQEYEVRAEIRSIRSMSAHGDYEDLLRFVSCQNPAQVKKVFLVHGEYDVQRQFSGKLKHKGFGNVEIPSRHQQFDLSDQ